MMQSFSKPLICLIGMSLFCHTGSLLAEEESLSAKDLAARLSETLEDGDSATRLRMKVKPAGGGEDVVLQVQVKARRSAEKTDVLYQVLWPKGNKGQAFLIQQERGGDPKGVSYEPSTKKVISLNKARMSDLLLGSDLAYQDVMENFFSWENHSLAGKEAVDRVECLILESKPGSKDSTPYSKVRSWIDTRKLVALRVEKYDGSGKLVLRIDASRAVKDDSKRYVPSILVISRPDSKSVTEIEGSNIRHDVKFKDKDFTTRSLNDFRLPR